MSATDSPLAPPKTSGCGRGAKLDGGGEKKGACRRPNTTPARAQRRNERQAPIGAPAGRSLLWLRGRSLSWQFGVGRNQAGDVPAGYVTSSRVLHEILRPARRQPGETPFRPILASGLAERKHGLEP